MSPHVRLNNYLLIENVRRCRALWDRTAQEKTELFVRERMWDEIAAKMCCTKTTVKARWKNLRDAYRKIIRKQEEVDTKWDPRWPYYKQMEFMKKIAKTAPPRCGSLEKRDSVCEDETRSGDALLAATSSLETSKRRCNELEAATPSYSYPELDPIKDLQPGDSALHVDDDDYQFLMSLYPHFKQVSQNRKLPLRMKIEQVIYEELYAAQLSQRV